jgi:hypothetical protein
MLLAYLHCQQVHDNKAHLAQLETRDCGKPLIEAEADMVGGHVGDQLTPTLVFPCANKLLLA